MLKIIWWRYYRLLTAWCKSLRPQNEETSQDQFISDVSAEAPLQVTIRDFFTGRTVEIRSFTRRPTEPKSFRISFFVSKFGLTGPRKKFLTYHDIVSMTNGGGFQKLLKKS